MTSYLLTILQQLLSSKHIFKSARMFAQRDLSFNVSPSSSNCIILNSKTPFNHATQYNLKRAVATDCETCVDVNRDLTYYHSL